MLKQRFAAAFFAVLALPCAAAAEMTVAVLEFTSIDIQGQKFYEFRDNRLRQGRQDSLSAQDRAVIDDRMLGMVKMLDAKEYSAMHRHERVQNDRINARERARRDDLADRIMKSPQRAIVIGAEYMRAAMEQYPQFKVMDSDEQIRALKAIRAGRPSNDGGIGDFGKFSGAQYLLYGTVADLQTRSTVFKGYGVQTKSSVYTLDVLVRMVDASTGKTVFSRVFSGSDREMQTDGVQTVDSGRYERMLKKAVAEAAAALDRDFPAKTVEVKK